MERVNDIHRRSCEFAEGSQHVYILEDQESSTQILVYIERQFCFQTNYTVAGICTHFRRQICRTFAPGVC